MRAARRTGLALALAAVTALPALAQNQMAPGDAGQRSFASGGSVTRWTIAADWLGGGIANWRTLALMHIAMHDTLNAITPRYRRFNAAAPGEPSAAGASAGAALAAAAYRVLLARHAETAPTVAEVPFRTALAAEPPGEGVEAGIRLGAAIADATLARYPAELGLPLPFEAGDRPGAWRPTPPDFLRAAFITLRPFLPAPEEDGSELRPFAVDSPEYLAALDEVRRVGALDSTERTPVETDAAEFWAAQSSQRSFVQLAVRLIRERPLPGGAWDEARLMSALTVALGDSAVLAWQEKARHGFWRPVTAINLGSPRVPADPSWRPLIDTPPHPDHPSGHASDCAAGAAVLSAVFGPGIPVTYVGLGWGGATARAFQSLSDVPIECAMSRLWAGVHFRRGNEEGTRLGAAIGRRAIEALPHVRE